MKKEYIGLVIIIALLLFLNSYRAETLFATVGIGYDDYNECQLAKRYYLDMGCSCPVDGWDCGWSGEPPAGAGYVLHCDGCPSQIGGEYPHYSIGKCSWNNGLCVDAESYGFISCGVTWYCDTSDWSHNCVCGVLTTTTTTTEPLGDNTCYWQGTYYNEGDKLCIEDDVHECYYNSVVGMTWKIVQSCQYGCEGSSCLQEQATTTTTTLPTSCEEHVNYECHFLFCPSYCGGVSGLYSCSFGSVCCWGCYPTVTTTTITIATTTTISSQPQEPTISTTTTFTYPTTTTIIEQITEYECQLKAECEGKSHIDCVGSWSCPNDKCVWTCTPEEPSVSKIPLLIGIGALIVISLLIAKSGVVK